MPRLAANLSTLFKELPFLERFQAARRAGFRAVEYQFPYDFPAADVAAAARDADMQVVLHNTPGDSQRGDFGPGTQPSPSSASGLSVPWTTHRRPVAAGCMSWRA